MQTPVVTLSLQFARFLNVAKHREALPRYKVARYIKHALQAGVQSLEITLRIVEHHSWFGFEISNRRCVLLRC